MSKPNWTECGFLSEIEAKEILSRVKNPFAQLALTIIYICGLRLSEVLRLRYEDIDFTKKTITVRSKTHSGPNIRTIPIPGWLLVELKKVRSISGWVFPAKTETGHISASTLHKAFKEALVAFSLKKPVTIMSLYRSRICQLWLQDYRTEHIGKFTGYDQRAQINSYINDVLSADGEEAPEK